MIKQEDLPVRFKLNVKSIKINQTILIIDKLVRVDFLGGMLQLNNLHQSLQITFGSTLERMCGLLV